MAVESLIVSAAFVCFCALVYKPAKNAIVEMLDSKIVEISATLQEAREIKFEAERLHKDAMLKLIEAEELAAKIVNNANEKAENILQSVEEDVTREIARKRRAYDQRLEQQEEMIYNQLKREVVSRALEDFKEKKMKQLAGEPHMELIVGSFRNSKKIIH